MKQNKLFLIVLLFLIGLGPVAFSQPGAVTEMPFTMGLNDAKKYMDLNGDDFYTDVSSGLGYDRTISLVAHYSQGGAAYENYSQVDQKQNGIEYVAKILDEGSEIGSGLNYYSNVYIAGWDVEQEEDIKGDNFTTGKREGYLACRIPINMPSDLKQEIPVDYQYAWVHILINDPQQTVTFLSSGFEEDLNTPIAAGDSPVVPIPLLTSILGFGLIGIAAMKKRIR